MYVFINIEYGAMMRTMQQLYNDNSTIKKIYMLNQHNLLWICCQSLCSIKREFLQIMATTTTPTPITIDQRRISRRFQKKLFVFAATFYNSFCAALFMFLDHLLWYFFNIIFSVLFHAYYDDYDCVVCFGYVAVRIMGEKNDNMSKKIVLFRPVNNRLKSVKFTKMFSVQCSNRVRVCVDAYFYFITNTGFVYDVAFYVYLCWLCCIKALVFFFKFHTHEWFAFWYADKNIFCLSIHTKKHRHHQHYIHSMLFMLCKSHLYHFLLNWITLFFSLIILS